MNEIEYGEFIEMSYSNEGNVIEYNTIFVHNLIYGAIDYADELGFEPQKDFKVSEYLLNPDLISDGIDKIKFGKNGKPFFIQGPDDNVTKIINQLDKVVGEGNYLYMRRDEDMEM